MEEKRTAEWYKATARKIVELLVNEKCTIRESRELLHWAGTEIEKSPTVQISED